MSKIVHIDQGHIDDNFYALEDDEATDGCGTKSDITIEEMGMYDFIILVDNLINEVLPQAARIVLDVGNVNDLCLAISALKMRKRD